MKRTFALALLAVAASSQANWYTSEASFMAALAAPNYTEDFSNFTFGNPLNGSQASWAAPGANGFGWTASISNGSFLYSNLSALSTNSANTTLVFTSTGSSFMAFGARWANSDISGALIAGTTTVTINGTGGPQQSTVNNLAGQEAFLGWVGNFVITDATAFSTGTTNNWVQADHVVVANPVPEPASMVALGLGAIALLRRKRK